MGKLKAEGDADCIKSPIPISNVPGREHSFLTDQGYLLSNKSHNDFTNTNSRDIFSSRSCGLMGRRFWPGGLRWFTRASAGEAGDGWVVSQDVEETGQVSVGTQRTRPGRSPYWR